MKITQLRALSGPNTWSVAHHHLILFTLDLEDPGYYTSERIGQLRAGFSMQFPVINAMHQFTRSEVTLPAHACKHTTVAKHVEALAAGLQTLAGMDCNFSNCRCTNTGSLFEIVVCYQEERAGRYAVNAALQMVEQLLEGRNCDLQKHLAALREILYEDRPGPSTFSIIEQAKRRNIPCIRLDDNALVQLGYGANQKRIEATIASTTSSIAVELAGDKQATKNILKASGIPVPAGGLAKTADELKALIDQTGFPLVIKPKSGNQGRGATIYINSEEEALAAFETAQKISEQVICEQFVAGADFRALVIDYRFVAAAMRMPAGVKGDGVHTISGLVERINNDPRRGNGHEKAMTRIILDDHSMRLLEKQQKSLQDILPTGEEVLLKTTANLSTGGTAIDVTDRVHPQNIALFNRIARTIGLDICGIDIMAASLETPVTENGGAVIEVNAAPGFRMHLEPSLGKPRNVAAPVIDMLFPNNSKGLIPIIAVTGTNGKTTTTCLTAHICRQQGFVTGYTTTEGIFIQDDQIKQGDCSGPVSAQMVLKDPSVQAAVFECARGGILRRGLGFNACDVAIVTNIAEDHLGADNIHSLKELALVKSVVPKSVKQNGYAVLNADDDLVYNMGKKLSCRIALFSMNAGNERIVTHCRAGGIAAVYEENKLTIIDGGRKLPVCHVNEVPITFDGMAEFNIANALPAILAGYVQGFAIENIRLALKTFHPSPEQTPGRLNIFRLRDFTLMIDYAHNPHGVKALGKFISHYSTGKRTGIIAGVGDRRDEDLAALGREAAQVFDEIIIRTDDDLRGRTVDQIFQLISSGIHQVRPELEVPLIASEEEALRTAVLQSKPGSFVVVLVDNVSRAIAIVKDFEKQAAGNSLLKAPLFKTTTPAKLAI